MCEPTTILAGASLVTSGVGLYMQSRAAYQGAEADNMALEYNAQVAENNAQMAQYNAAEAMQRGEENVANIQESVAQTQAAQRTGFAASGVAVDQGSALDVQADTAYQGEIDIQTARRNAQLEAWGYQIEGQNRQSQAGLLRAQKRRPGMAAATTLLTGAGSVLQQGADFNYRYGPSIRSGFRNFRNRRRG